MSKASPAALRLAAAERDAAAARERIGVTVAQLQARLDPRVLARSAQREAGHAAQVSLDAARQRPQLVAGVATALGLWVIGRPLLRLLRRPRGAEKPNSNPLVAPVLAPAPKEPT